MGRASWKVGCKREERGDREMVQWIGEGSYRESSGQNCTTINSKGSVWAFCSLVFPHSYPRCKDNIAATMMDSRNHLQ